MTRKTWLIVLIAGGIGLAILIGVLGTRNEPSSSTTKAQAVGTLCASLTGLESSLETLTKSTSTSEFQANATAVQTSWDSVTSAAQGVQSASMGPIDDAWNTFTASLKNATSAGSASAAVSDISESANALVSTAKSTASSVNCS